MSNKEISEPKQILYCANCGKELDMDKPLCDECNAKLDNQKTSLFTVPMVILIFISLCIGIFIIWDIIFMDFSGNVIRICEIDYERSHRLENECIPPTYKKGKNFSYAIEIFSDDTKSIKRINFNEYPILFNQNNYNKLFMNLEQGDYISKSYLSPYYIVNNDVYVLIGSPLQVILLASIFILILPIILPKFVKDFIRDNKHLGKIGRR